MLSQKCNIYVSATKGLSNFDPDSDGEHKYRRAEHAWMISVEPHQHHTPLIHKEKNPEPVHLVAIWNPETGRYDITSQGAEHHDGIIGNVLVADSARANVNDMKSLLVKRLNGNQAGLPSENTSPDEPEHWVRVGLHALQGDELVELFDVGEFMTFAHAFVANRLEDSGTPAMVAYPGLHKDHEKRSQKHSFWLSYPMAGQVRAHSGTGTFGGLI